MKFSRRSFIVTAIGAGLAGGGAMFATRDGNQAYQWRGAALGGEARVVLFNADEATARTALVAIENEIERLENIFSLHRETSQLRQLNRDGRLAAPSHDLVDVLNASLEWKKKTAGAFDPTVQPIWLSAAAGEPISSQVLERVGGDISINGEAVTLTPGGSLTLNGIAQGHIADRVTGILGAHGFNDVVIDAGELRLAGRQRRAVGIRSAKVAVSVAEIAVATSEPKSLVFDPRSFRHHLIDPRTGDSPRHWLSISVFAPTARMADALSTGFCVLHHDVVADLVASLPEVAVVGADAKGRIRRYGNLGLLRAT